MPQLSFAIHASHTLEALELLKLAEERYGPRDPQWKFSGVTEQSGGPMIIFPMPLTTLIAVSSSAVNDFNVRQFQLAHEVIHLLSPSQSSADASMIEEGLAVRFSLDAPAYADPTYPERALASMRNNPASQNYVDALDLHDAVEALRPGALAMLRTKQPLIHTWTPEFLMEHLAIDTALASQLCARVSMRKRSPLDQLRT